MALLPALVLLLPPPVCARQLGMADEYDLKAAMLFNLSKFVEWPYWKAGAANAPLVLGVWGPANVAAALEKAVRDKSAGGRPVTVRHLSTGEGGEECHVLFVGRTEQRRFREREAALAKAAVLTVGESDRFAPEGGVIGLVVRDSHVQLEVNLRSAQRSGLNISSRVLKLAVLVQGE